LALSKKSRSVIIALVSIAVAVCVFFGGYLTGNLTAGNNSLRWAQETIEKYYCGEISDKVVSFSTEGYTDEEIAIKALTAKLDPYSEYMTAAEYKATLQDNQGSKSGLGISYNSVEGRGGYIISVMGNSPAWYAGLRQGDVICGGKSADGEYKDLKSSSALGEFITERAENEEFSLTLEDGRTVTLAKINYRASYTCMYTQDSVRAFSYDGKGQPVMNYSADNTYSFLPEKAAYVRVNQFYGAAADEFGQLVANFRSEGLSTMFLDLRNNGGGYVTVMQDIAGYFTSGRTSESCVAMTCKYKSGRTDVYACARYKAEKALPADTKVYILANTSTASASEALTGVLVSYGIVGYQDIFLSDYSKEYLAWRGEGAPTGRSYGKGIMQTTYVNRPKGDALKLTNAKIYWQNGKCIHGVGLTEKDGCRLSPAAWTATKDDSELRWITENL